DFGGSIPYPDRTTSEFFSSNGAGLLRCDLRSRRLYPDQELVLKGTVEALVHRIVLRVFHAGPVVVEAQRIAGFVEIPTAQEPEPHGRCPLGSVRKLIEQL